MSGDVAAATIAVLRSSEVTADRQLGAGGFCTVSSVRRINVQTKDTPQQTHDDGDDGRASAVEEEGDSARRRFAKRFRDYEKKHFSRRHVPGQPPHLPDPAEQKPPRVAIKRVKSGLGKERRETGGKDLAAEVEILSRCSHPNIIALYAIGREGGDGSSSSRGMITFAVIDQLRSTLRNKLYKWREDRGLGIFVTRKALNELWLERMVVLLSIADALSYLHSRGITHRDVSPDNIGFDADDIPKLFDFGLAKVLGGDDSRSSSSSSSSSTSSCSTAGHTATNSTDAATCSRAMEDDLFNLTGNTGTLRYMAQEVAQGLPYGLKCDVYSFALVMHEVMSLVKPYVNVHPSAFTSVVVKGGLRPSLDPTWPQGLRDLLQRMWASDSAKRPSSRQVVEALQLLLRGPDNDLYPRGLFS